MAGSKGNVILLVGPSCAGKSTLAGAVQTASQQPYLVQSLDGLFATTPDGWGSAGEHTLEGFHYDWAGAPVRRIGYGADGWRLLQGFHRAVAAFADADVNVVVDDMLLDREMLADWARALAAVPTLLVSVTAPKEELLRREAARQLHPTPGLVAGHYDLHQGIVADIWVDTSQISSADAARRLLELASPTARGTALKASRRS